MFILKTYRIFLFLFVLLNANLLLAKTISFPFLGDTIVLNVDEHTKFPNVDVLDDNAIQSFYNEMEKTDYKPLIAQMLDIRNQLQLNDWMYYQFIRYTAQQLSPKSDNYNRYTLCKWFLLAKSGYDAKLSFTQNHLLFYVRTEDNIYGIPYFEKNQYQYVCLNIHDFGQIDFKKEPVIEASVVVPEAQQTFSYKITHMPNFKSSDYAEKQVQFNYQDKIYRFNIKLNPQVKSLFTNYPVADFSTYFNIPLSNETYGSLIPELKKNIEGMPQQKGIDYLMHFTRDAFVYETDQQNFGKEKRLSPEQTLLYDRSDCDDRAGLFFYLVKEIYNLPMIAMLYPTHITIAVQFDTPVGKPVLYNGKSYSVCDPTPQQNDLAIGEVSRRMKHSNYEVVYEYTPTLK